MRDMTPRQQQRAGRVQEVLALAVTSGQLHTLGQLGIPVTITKVWISADNKHAKAFFTVIGDEKAVARVEHALQAAVPTAQQLIAKRLKTFSTPKLQFIHDDRFDDIESLDSIFDRIKTDDQATS